MVGEWEDATGRTSYIYGKDEGKVSERVAEAIKNHSEEEPVALKQVPMLTEPTGGLKPLSSPHHK